MLPIHQLMKMQGIREDKVAKKILVTSFHIKILEKVTLKMKI